MRLEAAKLYILNQQNSDGGWTREEDDWHTFVTAWSLLGLASCSLVPDTAMDAGIRWLSARRTPDGGFAQSSDIREPNTYSTSYAVAALYAATDKLQEAAAGLRWLSSHQDVGGGYRDNYSVASGSDPSLTAYVAHALSRLPAEASDAIVSRCAQFIAGVQRPSGAWAAWYEDLDSIEGTAAALRVLMADEGDYSE
ncbi:prenyltransferase/squalene oxidase repeat-containing protein [Nonomuraea sp. NPDC004702]